MAHETEVPADIAFWSLVLTTSKIRDNIKLARFQAEDIEANFEDCSRDKDGATAWLIVQELRKAIDPLLAQADALIVRASDIAKTYRGIVTQACRPNDSKELQQFTKKKVALRDELDDEERT